MQFVILSTLSKVSKSGKLYSQAACKGTSKSGSPFFFLATIPDDLLDHDGEVLDRNVVFNDRGNAFVLPY